MPAGTLPRATASAAAAQPRRRAPKFRCTLAITAAAITAAAACLAGVGVGEAQESWKTVPIPQSWKKPPAEISAQGNGHAWFRCQAQLPDDWQGRDLELYVEAADDAREVFVAGESIGTLGVFPPKYRSGLGQEARLKVPARLTNSPQLVVAIRLYMKEARSNFNVAPPTLFGAEEAIRLEGPWEMAVGPGTTKLAGAVASDTPAYVARLPRKDAERILKRLEGEEGPLAVAEALGRMEVADDLQVDVPLADPVIGQPLHMKFDERGRMWVVEYLQYPNPAGLTMLSRDKFLRSVYDKVPPAPPHHFPGRDRISIHEDTDGDGRYDKHGNFVDGLSLVSSFALGRGGVFVLNPPYLLFYPDADGDDAPDGDPEVLLEGFGIEDSHSICNNLRWGPDGWLYAAQGSTVTGHVRRPGAKDAETIHSMGQLIWRYHPEQRRYEIFAEGGGNSFGVEIDSRGRIYSGHNGGDTRGFHYVQGGYYRKGFGKHGELSNPAAYGYFEHMGHHSVARFTHTFVIYEGAALPPRYQGGLFGVAPLLSHVVFSQVMPDRSSFKTQDDGHPLQTKDPWFRPVDIRVGPDGAVYVADFYEQRIDHSSHYQGRVDRDSGRIYRLRAKDAAAAPPFNLRGAATGELIARLRHPNKWHRQTALRLLGDRRDPAAIPVLKKMLAEERGQAALEALWALNLSGGFDEALAADLLDHADPFVRLWTVRLLCDARTVSDEIAQRIASLATREDSVQSRSQIACSARRLPVSQGQPIVRNLLLHSEDASDIHVPLLLWWAVETQITENPESAASLLAEESLWRTPLVREHLLQRMMRRLSGGGSRRELLVAAELLERAVDEDAVDRLMKGFEESFQGRQVAGLPEALVAAMSRRGRASLPLRVRQGESAAIVEAIAKAADPQHPRDQRLQLIEALAQTGQKRSVTPLLQLARAEADAAVRAAALNALQAFDDPQIGQTVLEIYSQLPDDAREVAQSLLVSRPRWTRQLLAAVESGAIEAKQIPLPVVRRMLLHQDPQLEAEIGKHWGSVEGATSQEMLAQIAKFGQWIEAAPGNPYNGKTLFKSNCGKCHMLFNEGGKIGPDLTAFKRDDLRNMLLNVVNPSIEIREGYENYVLQTEDGLRLNGFIVDRDKQVVVLKKPDGQIVVIPQDDIVAMKAVPLSIMPQGALNEFNEQQVRDLFAYLRATQPLP